MLKSFHSFMTDPAMGNPFAERIFKIGDTDIGPTLTHFNHRLCYQGEPNTVVYNCECCWPNAAPVSGTLKIYEDDPHDWHVFPPEEAGNADNLGVSAVDGLHQATTLKMTWMTTKCRLTQSRLSLDKNSWLFETTTTFGQVRICQKKNRK